MTILALRGSREDLGLLDEGTADGDALLLASREIFGALGGEAGDVHLVERGEGDGAVLAGP